MWINLLISVALAAVMTYGLARALRWRAPARKNEPWKTVFGFFPPLLLMTWAASAWLTPRGPTDWGVLWLAIGLIGFLAGMGLATIASPREPSKREERRMERREGLLDPVFLAYCFGMAVAVMAAVVTRATWA